MKQRKKKLTSSQIKQESQHQRNEFYKKIKQTMILIGAGKAFDYMDEAALLALYYTRLRPYKIVNPKDGKSKKASKRTLLTLNNHLSTLLHNSFVKVGEQQIKVSMYDFFVYIETLYLIWRNLPDDKLEKTMKFRDSFTLFDEKYKKERVRIVAEVLACLDMLSWAYSDITGGIYLFTHEKTESKSVYDNSAFYNNYVLEIRPPETELLELDGHRRTIYRICMNIGQKVVPLEIPTAHLGLTGLMEKFPLRVFIQQHAIDRAKERLGSWFMEFGYIRLASMIMSKPIPADGNHCYLFPVVISKIKIGYLKADLIGDRLVIRTVLFLTNNGTPEGKKLKSLIGLQKEDKKYLGIDKLSTFVYSDMRNDEKLKALFCEAGCGDLFKIDKRFLNESDKEEFTCAESMKHYLGMDQDNIVAELPEADTVLSEENKAVSAPDKEAGN